MSGLNIPGSIEPEYFYSTYDQELWAKWRNEAKYDPKNLHSGNIHSSVSMQEISI